MKQGQCMHTYCVPCSSSMLDPLHHQALTPQTTKSKRLAVEKVWRGRLVPPRHLYREDCVSQCVHVYHNSSCNSSIVIPFTISQLCINCTCPMVMQLFVYIPGNQPPSPCYRGTGLTFTCFLQLQLWHSSFGCPVVFSDILVTCSI